MRVLTFGFVAILLSACAGASPSAVTSPSPSVVAIASTPPTASPAPQPTPTATPIAVLPGEPWIVYGWSVDGGWYLALMRPDGSDAHKILTEVPGEPKAADWSPDGQTLAFVVKGADYPEGSIWTANADGSGAALLSAGGTECPVGLFHPSWSPDGAKLAVVCYPGGDDREAVAILDIATKSLTRLATFKTPDFLDNAATWSPDGRTIAFDILHWDPTGAFIDGRLSQPYPSRVGRSIASRALPRSCPIPTGVRTAPSWS